MGKISKLVALTLLMSFALSQTTGKIRGTVTSADGQPLAGANVIVDGTTKGAATDGEGNYTILNVEAGSYSVTASYIGYQSSTESNVSVKVDLTTPLSVAMQTTAVEGEAVTILGENKSLEEAKYIHGKYGNGTWTFYGGHDPEDYQHRVGDPKTDLNLHTNSPGYRLILNNILLPAAKKKKLKT